MMFSEWSYKSSQHGCPARRDTTAISVVWLLVAAIAVPATSGRGCLFILKTAALIRAAICPACWVVVQVILICIFFDNADSKHHAEEPCHGTTQSSLARIGQPNLQPCTMEQSSVLSSVATAADDASARANLLIHRLQRRHVRTTRARFNSELHQSASTPGFKSGGHPTLGGATLQVLLVCHHDWVRNSLAQ